MMDKKYKIHLKFLWKDMVFNVILNNWTEWTYVRLGHLGILDPHVRLSENIESHPKNSKSYCPQHYPWQYYNDHYSFDTI